MSSKKSYNRFFIILQEEDKGYGMGPDRPPTGYVKVETKNDKSKITVYAQNLKPFETGEYLYRCYLISHQDGKDNTAYLGIMNIDESGRGESSWESGAGDAFGTKVPIDKFNGAVIIADREGLESVIAPLAGYMSKEKFEWRSKISKGGHIVAEQEAEKEAIEADKNKAEAQKFEEYEKQVEEAVKVNAAASPVIEKRPELKNIVEDNDMEDIRGKHKHHEKCEEEKHEEHEECKEEKHGEHVEHIEHEECEKHEEHEECKEEKHEEHVEHIEHEECKKHEKHEECKEEKHEEHMEHIEHEECKKHEEHEECKEHKEHEHHEHHMEHEKLECHEDEDYPRLSRRLAMVRALQAMLRDYIRVEDCKELKDCSIWKVDMEKCRRDGYMVRMYPYYDLLFYPMLYNPEVNYFKYIAKHGHYLFGIKHGRKGEVKEIIFGIRGKRRIEDQPFKGRTGFVRWISFSGDDDGYWLMMYDPITGIVNSSEK